ncbi:Universal stress protein family protein [Cupriavidus sp. YR651]|uniref:universal stress protein n=1 Tax=Cupriavidus sp. YR651 TaxID=1855315 RepID=UPI00088ECEDB|nr:universal stress protein [Cupriavidus sp. YR651]SDD82236.1 Universal stress protein family protein [Cupriavidus sp. YR651]
MDYKTVLVDLGDDNAREARLEAATLLASISAGRVVGLTALGMQLEPYRSAGQAAGLYATMGDSSGERIAHADAMAMRDVVDSVAPAVRISQVVADQEAGWALATQGHFADIVLPAPPTSFERVPAPMAKAAEYALLNAGRPVLLVPSGARFHLGGHILVAWDGRREAARAVADALPLLKKASRVTIQVIATLGGRDDKGATGVVQWLGAHGIAATVRVGKGDRVADSLLRIADTEQVSLVVAGGYGHSRLGELVMGGTTHALMRHSKTPLFLSH